MKTKLSAFILAALISLVAIAATNTTNDYQTATPYYAYSVTDTITDGENDTITIPTRLVSKWTSLYHVTTTSLSGTVGLSNIVQEAASYNASDWVQVDSINHTAAGTKRLDNEIVYGPRQRLVIDGDGTQSTRYTVYFFAKKD